MSAFRGRPPLSPGQLEAVTAAGAVFVDAGAGSGKTTVLVERYLEALIEHNRLPTQILAVTFTNRAAGELRERVRSRLREEERNDLVGAVEAGWIDTIHGACRRILREEGGAADLPVGLRVADPIEAILLRDQAFDDALRATIAAHGDEGVALAAAYGRERLRTVVGELLDGARRSATTPHAPRPEADPGRLDEALAALVTAAGAERDLDGETDATARRKASAADLLALLERQPTVTELVDLQAFRSRGPQDFKDAVAAVEAAARDHVALGLADPLDDLLTRFDALYRARKDAAGVVDQDDLLVRTLALLEGDAAVRERLRERFREILIDEFQDTDALQVRIIAALRADTTPLLLVGDEQQSIYGFRGADVGVFRAARSTAADDGTTAVVALAENRRSRPELVAAVNALFGRDGAFAHRPLLPVREPGAAGPAVELLIGAGERIDDGRDIEAALIAARLRALVEQEGYRPGEIALLFRAGTRARVYEQALRAVGLPTVASTGRGFLQRQPVADVVALLRVLWNRYDDLALYACLASPMAGVTNDGLALLASAGEWEVVEVLDDLDRVGLDAADAARVVALREALERLRRSVGRLGLGDLVAEAIAETGYDVATLALADGVERMANLDKLQRVARAYEEARGPDLPGFVRAIESGRLDGELRAEGVVASEDDDVVRLMTIHQAKGLEFPVVVVADTAAGRGREAPLALTADDGRCAAVVPAASGRLEPTTALDELRAERATVEEAEAKRLAYVACTRARERLLIGGARGERSAGATTLAWFLELIGDEAAAGERVVDLDGAAIRVEVRSSVPAPATVAPPVDEPVGDPGDQLTLDVDALPAAAGPSPASPGPLVALAVDEAAAVPSLSYSALDLLERCPYRFRVQRQAGLPSPAAVGAAAIGQAVHRAIEQGAAADVGRLVREADPAADAAAVEQAQLALERFHRSPLHARFQELPVVHHEQAFAFVVDGAVIGGRYDLSGVVDGRLLIGDLKVGGLHGMGAAERRDAGYAIQEQVYALAGLEAGFPAVTVLYQWVGDDAAAGDLAERTFTTADQPELRAAMAERVRRAVDGPWPARPAPEVCGGCPAFGALCAGTEGGDDAAGHPYEPA